MDCKNKTEEEIRRMMYLGWRRSLELMRNARLRDAINELFTVEKLRRCLRSEEKE